MQDSAPLSSNAGRNPLFLLNVAETARITEHRLDSYSARRLSKIIGKSSVVELCFVSLPALHRWWGLCTVRTPLLSLSATAALSRLSHSWDCKPENRGHDPVIVMRVAGASILMTRRSESRNKKKSADPGAGVLSRSAEALERELGCSFPLPVPEGLLVLLN